MRSPGVTSSHTSRVVPFPERVNPGLRLASSTPPPPTRAQVLARAQARLERLDVEQIQVVELAIVAIMRGATS